MDDTGPGFDLPENCDPRVRELISYWDSIRPDGGIPGRQNLDPGKIPSALANIWLIDVRWEPTRFRFRLVGTRVVEFLGRDPTGCWIDEVYPSFPKSSIEDDFVACAVSGKPRWRRGPPFMEAGKDYALVERIALPLATNGEDTDMLLCLSLYEK
jgi:hypothetical protein